MARLFNHDLITGMQFYRLAIDTPLPHHEAPILPPTRPRLTQRAAVLTNPAANFWAGTTAAIPGTGVAGLKHPAPRGYD